MDGPVFKIGRFTLLFKVLVLALAGCSSIELDETNPPGVALSGEWRLDRAQSDATPDLRPGHDRRPPRRGGDQRSIQRGEIMSAAGSGIAFIEAHHDVIGPLWEYDDHSRVYCFVMGFKMKILCHANDLHFLSDDVE